VLGRLHHVVIDCHDPASLAEFYSALLGRPVTYRTEDFCVVAESNEHSGLAFQRAPGHQAPTWPEVGVPQQIHLDVMVEDVAAAGAEALRLGARHLAGAVYADPAGHPFCLVPRPAWAAPLSERGPAS
jgi:catechol 2,3-dioxygenase-like lactoylglutathione lyase family enzyme